MEWIRVQDQLPEIDHSVLLYSEYNGICCGYRVTDTAPIFSTDEEHEREYMMFGYSAEISTGVTHWMPLPEPPQTT